MATTRRTDRFQKGTGCFRCVSCGKMTRITAVTDGYLGLDMCPFCFEQSGLENELQDGIITEAQYDERLKELEARYGRNAEAERAGQEADALYYGGK